MFCPIFSPIDSKQYIQDTNLPQVDGNFSELLPEYVKLKGVRVSGSSSGNTHLYMKTATNF